MRDVKKMKTMPLLILAGLLISTLSLTGCGSDSGNGSDNGVKKYPEIELEPSTLCTKGSDNKLSACGYIFDQSQVLPGQTATVDIRVLNTGQAYLDIEEVTLNYTAPEGVEEAIPAFELVLDQDLQAAIDAGDTLTITPKALPEEGIPGQATIRVRYTRYDDEKAREASLTLKTNAANSPNITIALGISEGAAKLDTSPSEVLDFGMVHANENVEKNLNILNVGSSQLLIDGFHFSGSQFFSMTIQGQEYQVAGSASDKVVLDPPIELAPSDTYFFKVKFAPENEEKADGTLIIYSNDPAKQEGHVVYLKGNQSGPCIAVNPEEVEFRGQLIGELATLNVKVTACGDSPLEIYSVYMEEGSSPDFSVNLSSLDHDPTTDDPIVVPIGGSIEFNMEFVPDVENPLDGNGIPINDLGVLIIANNSFYDKKQVPVSGHGSNKLCPTAIIECAEGTEVIPQTLLHLYGDKSLPEGKIAQWEWSVQQPDGSQSVFMPSDTFPNPTFETNVAGTYTFYLTVYDVNSVPSCTPDTLDVVVIPDEAIHIELLWHTPEDPDETDEGPEAGSDLDLHFTHPYAAGGADLDGDGQPDPWFDQPFDCFWFNGHPEWGSFDPNIDDNPGLDRDDTDGAGPENINLNIPEDVVYKVGVNYWNDHSFGSSFATLRVYIYSKLVWEITDVKMVSQDMWEVCTIEWPSGKVTPVTTSNGQYKITPNYDNPFFN